MPTLRAKVSCRRPYLLPWQRDCFKADEHHARAHTTRTPNGKNTRQNALYPFSHSTHVTALSGLSCQILTLMLQPF